MQPNLSISFLNFLNRIGSQSILISDVKEMAIREHCLARVPHITELGLVSLSYVCCFCVLYRTVLCCIMSLDCIFIPCSSNRLRYFFIVYVLLPPPAHCLPTTRMAVSHVLAALVLLPALSLWLWKWRPVSRLPIAVRYDYELSRQVRLN